MATASVAASRFFIISCIILLCVEHTEAAVYVVGDDDEWTLGVNYDEWSQKYNFTVGDTLVFRYVNTQHNVYMVRQRTFMSCNASAGVLKIYTSGNDQIVLRSRKYWFICGVPGHCSGGMKFGLNLLGVGNRITNGTIESPAAAPVPSPSGANHRLPQPTTLFVILLILIKHLV
ncbi:unnamed protein product [Victoria cruziana]